MKPKVIEEPPIIYWKMEKLLKELKNKKAQGEDGFLNELLINRSGARSGLLQSNIKGTENSSA